MPTIISRQSKIIALTHIIEFDEPYIITDKAGLSESKKTANKDHNTANTG